jgi:hypothetical protein
MNVRIGWTVVVAAVLIGSGGCGSGRVKVTGRVTYKGDPVPSTEVYFQPDDGSRRSHGLTDDEGRFSLRYSTQEDGAPPGRYTVYLKYAPSGAEETHLIAPKASAELRGVIAKFGDVSKSKIHVEVNKNGQVVEIKLDEIQSE